MIQIRPYQASDRAAAVQVYHRAVRIGAAAFHSEAERAAWAQSSVPDLDTADKLLDQWCLVAHDADRMTGFMSMDRTGYLDMAFVIPEVMGNGTAAALYDALMAIARGHGLHHFTVHAAHQSHRFQSRRGWVVDHFERYENHGQVFDRFHMSLTDPAGA